MLQMQAQIEQLNQKWQMTENYLKAGRMPEQHMLSHMGTRTTSLHTESVPSIHVESTQRDALSKKDDKSSAKKSPGKMTLNARLTASNAFSSV